MILPAGFDPDAPFDEIVEQLAAVYPRDVAEDLALHFVDGPVDGFPLG